MKKQFYVLLKDGRILPVPERKVSMVNNVFCINALVDGVLQTFAESLVVYCDSNLPRLEQMNAGTLKIKTASDWWFGFIAISANLTDYEKYPGVAKIAAKVRDLEESLGHLEERTLQNAIDAHDLLQTIWETVPDEPEIHNLPRWSMFCDLCSEFCVFD